MIAALVKVCPTSAALSAAVVFMGAAVGAEGCKKDASKPAAERPAVAAAQPAPQPTPWYVGEWTGTYRASLFRIEMSDAEGAVKEWAQDDPSSLTGSGSLRLGISEDHRVSGDAKGPLGKLMASGEVDGDTLRVSLKPAAPAPAEQVSSATLLAARKGDSFEGQLRASTGDSLKVRVATVSLTKQVGSKQGAEQTPDPGKRRAGAPATGQP
jgi:hypothetical protein